MKIIESKRAITKEKKNNKKKIRFLKRYVFLSGKRIFEDVDRVASLQSLKLSPLSGLSFIDMISFGSYGI